ncbi:MAG: TetR family transcriptional regulator [Gammaproteobacteria bacterium]
MGRTRQFDAAQALDQAMEVFWQKGYADTSMDDLVQATGVSRYGIYGTFGNKRELFLAALDRYAQMTAGVKMRALRQPDASLPEIKGYFRDMLRLNRSNWADMGCMICNTAIEVAPQDEEIEAAVQGYLTMLTVIFSKALKNAKAKGEIPADTDHRRMGRYLTGQLMGLVVFVRSGMAKKDIKAYAESVIDSLG